jgi:hypothetical protein
MPVAGRGDRTTLGFRVPRRCSVLISLEAQRSFAEHDLSALGGIFDKLTEEGLQVHPASAVFSSSGVSSDVAMPPVKPDMRARFPKAGNCQISKSGKRLRSSLGASMKHTVGDVSSHAV